MGHHCLVWSPQYDSLSVTFHFQQSDLAPHVEADILHEIRRQFGETKLQYICIASEKNSNRTKSHLHIQVITKQTINKKSWFLDEIAGKI